MRQRICRPLAEALAALARGKCALVLPARVRATHCIRTRNLVHVFATDRTVPELDDELSMAVRLSDPALLDRLHEDLAHLRENGTDHRIDEKWIGPWRRGAGGCATCNPIASDAARSRLRC